ncbi:unnamed protein product [Diplocarpon coronariae]
MLSASQHPPRGPRGSAPRGGGRGGIQKRRTGGPVPVDRDGDLVMDAAAPTQARSGRGRMDSTRSARTPSGPPGRASGGRQSGGRSAQSSRPTPSGRGNYVSEKSKLSVIRGLGAGQAKVLPSRISVEATRLQIGGLNQSKAASNPDGGLESLLGFLERKASALNQSNGAVRIKKSSKVGDSVFITASPEDIAAIQKLDTFTFAGAALTIRVVDSSDQQTEPKTNEVREQFKEVLARRYDGNAKLLNLSALATDAGLQKMGMFDVKNPHKIFLAMMVVASNMFESRQAKREAIVSVSLTDNHLEDVKEVMSLVEYFPDIKNIDLSRNNLAGMKSLDAWNSNYNFKFRHLENLVLAGNPIEAELPTLKDALARRYRKLQTLNNVPLRTPEQIAADLDHAATLFPISGPRFNDVSDVGKTFVTQFLGLYDTDRSALLASYYDSESVFSLNINMSAPRSSGLSVPIQPWAEYTRHSRNLEKINHLNARMNRQYKGIEAIQLVWASLPATKHPNLLGQTEKYIIECDLQAGLPDPSRQSAAGVNGLIITMHGEFADNTGASSEKSIRSFSRTFILGPGAPGGPQIRVVSDMLALRAWAPLAQFDSAAAQALPAPQSTMTPEQAELEHKKALASQLMEKTGMTLEYSGLCLDNAGWNLETAYKMFNESKVGSIQFLTYHHVAYKQQANLPQDAWLNGITS